MAYFPTSETGLQFATSSPGPNVAPSQTITASGSTNTKGSYTELISSAAFTANWAYVYTYASAASNGRQYLYDIATGAAAAEVVRLPDILAWGGPTSAHAGAAGNLPFPLAVASGTRVAARCQSTTGGGTLNILVRLIAAGSLVGISTFTNHGAVTADSGGTSYDPGGSANTKGSYTQLAASTAAVAQYLMLMTSVGGNTQPTSNGWAIDIATGAAASEVVLIPDLRQSVLNESTDGVLLWQPSCHAFPVYIPASTRIAVRASVVGTDATDRLIDMSIYIGTAPDEPVTNPATCEYYPASALNLSYVTYPVGPGATVDIILPAAGANNTKSAYVQAVASAPFTSNQAIIHWQFTQSLSRTCLLDIATGAAASETVVVPNLLNEGNAGSTSWVGKSWDLPLSIPMGSRIAARYQINDITGGLTPNSGPQITLSAGGGRPGITSFTNYGAATSTSRGTQVDPGGTIDTKGSYSQMTASTAAVSQSITLCMTGIGNTAPTSSRWKIDIATGAAASEVVLIPDLLYTAAGTVFRYQGSGQTFPTYIPASTRIAVRASSGINDATDRLIDVAVVVGTAPATVALERAFTFIG
jgi:hypothetical protein